MPLLVKNLMNDPEELTLKHKRAQAWASGMMLAAVPAVLAVCVLPGASALIVWALEAVAGYAIGRIYRGAGWRVADVKAVPALVGWGELFGPVFFLEAASFLGALAPWVKVAIAATMVKRMCGVVITYLSGLAPEEVA
jgi:hypothetical protein